MVVQSNVDSVRVPVDRVQLVYAKDMAGESGEVTIENGTFSIPIEFLTQSRRPVVNGLLSGPPIVTTP